MATVSIVIDSDRICPSFTQTSGDTAAIAAASSPVRGPTTRRPTSPTTTIVPVPITATPSRAPRNVRTWSRSRRARYEVNRGGWSAAGCETPRKARRGAFTKPCPVATWWPCRKKVIASPRGASLPLTISTYASRIARPASVMTRIPMRNRRAACVVSSVSATSTVVVIAPRRSRRVIIRTHRSEEPQTASRDIARELKVRRAVVTVPEMDDKVFAVAEYLERRRGPIVEDASVHVAEARLERYDSRRIRGDERTPRRVARGRW